MNRVLFGLFIFGILLVIVGWMIDKASHIPWLLRIISPDYADGISALNGLAGNNKRALLPTHPGFNVLIKYWPELQKKERVVAVGRSVAFTEFGSTIRNDFELIAYDKDKKEVGKRWSDKGSRQLLTKQFERREFWFGTIVFYIGITISLITGIVKFMSDDA